MDSAGAKSILSDDMQELTKGKEGIMATIRGHKANLSNPNTSEESKENSRAVIEHLGGDDTMEALRDNPISKSAAQKLYGSRAKAV
ncbi:hypothetical protein BT67DRAFT_412744 [Trichocladium antarcticum]|uniref:Conidiation-specific protein 6 n=1 Tax=Trichocladium antarcticum TaxID=1450529 RepID=A0AAN6UT39_9PEZI|nr:hypothetical protein BT67DRAFT_412744 [Trichocladium antarcticum]